MAILAEDRIQLGATAVDKSDAIRPPEDHVRSRTGSVGNQACRNHR